MSSFENEKREKHLAGEDPAALSISEAFPGEFQSASLELTILMPCLNEAETLGTCILKARSFLEREGIPGEILIADNGSKDGSPEIARRNGARVVAIEDKGYGSALLGGIRAAAGKYIIMGDADDSYDFIGLKPFVDRLRQGSDLVMGNRFQGGIKPGAMPALHRYLGNPVLTAIGRIFFHSQCGDFHCGLRGFKREAILGLRLQTTGMEFASEMVIKATLQKLRIEEVPTTLSPDGRSRPPHLRSWRDGWRHLRFMLLYSPRWLFLYPGLLLMLIGLAGGACLITGQQTNSLLYGVAAILIGLQSISFAAMAKTFAINEGLLPPDRVIRWIGRWFSLELNLVFGVGLIAAGLLAALAALFVWSRQSFGALQSTVTLRLVIPSVLAMVIGFQLVLNSFFLSILNLGRKRPER